MYCNNNRPLNNDNSYAYFLFSVHDEKLGKLVLKEIKYSAHEWMLYLLLGHENSCNKFSYFLSEW